MIPETRHPALEESRRSHGEPTIDVPSRTDEAPRIAVALEVGTVLEESYEIEAFISEGGMGSVWRARDVKLDRSVAIKFLKSSQLTTPTERVNDEARAMALVRHPNVVQIHACGDYKGTPYLVMEYVAGASLASVLSERRGLRLPKRWPILAEICAAVQAIHEKNLAHRDLKPANVLIDESGRVAVTDFGLACRVDRGNVSNRISGTPGYLAPELLVEEFPDTARAARADLYSLGILAFELLTGRHPFADRSATQLLSAQAFDPLPAMSTFWPDVPEAVETSIRKACSKSPDDRQISVRAFCEELSAGFQRYRVGHGATVLVADDDDVFRDGIATILRSAMPSLRVECARSGSAAVALARELEPTLILLDLDMPEMNGDEVTRAVRETVTKDRTPILVMTAHGTAEDWSVLRKNGAQACLLKPFDAEDLVRLVRQYLRDPSPLS